MSLGFYLLFPLMVILTIIQSTFLPHFPIFGVVPQLSLLVIISWALLRDWQEALLWALIAGILNDLLSLAPVGASSLALMAAIAVVVILQRNLPQYRIVIPVILTIIATTIFWLVYLVIIRIVIPIMVEQIQLLGLVGLTQSLQTISLMNDITGSYGFNRFLVRYILTLSFLHSLLVLPFYWGLAFLQSMFRPRRVEL